MKIVTFSGVVTNGDGKETRPLAINVEEIRSFRPRSPHRDGTPREGTRITMKYGQHLPVTDSFEAVLSAVAPTIN